MLVLFIKFVIVVAISILAGCISTDSLPQNLLNSSLSKFENIYPHGDAKFENGELSLTSTKNWFLTTKDTYRDFVLTAEVRLPDVKEYSNSGILFRGQVKQTDEGRIVMGYQAEVDPSTRKWSGGLFDQGRRLWLHPLHAKRSKPDEKFIKTFIPTWTDELSNAYKHLRWNRYRIECRGNEIKIYVNDILTTHVLDSTDQEGVIGFQHHGSKQLLENGRTDNVVRFRNVFIKEL